MDSIASVLALCPLFDGMSDHEALHILQDIPYSLRAYSKNQMIAVEGEPCSSIGIVIYGSIDIKKIFPSGKSITITVMNRGDIFGEVLVFAKTNRYPSTIIAAKETKVLYISRESVLRLAHSNVHFMSNLMRLLADKVLLFNDKISYLSLQTIRQRISALLLDYNKLQGKTTLLLPFNRKEMAELLGIPRPSLSRVLICMKNDGLIDYEKNRFAIKNSSALEDILLH